MKSLLSAFILLVFLHLIAAVGFVGWLKATDRLDADRVQRVVSIFKPTLGAEATALARVKAVEEEAMAARDELARLDRAGRGPQTLEAQLASNRADDNYDRHRLERLKAETAAIRTRLEQDKGAIARDLEELKAREAAFQQRVDRRTKDLQSDDFRRAVASLEQLPSKQAKGVLQSYVDAGQDDLAVDYLAAMQMRKSAGVLKAFKSKEELLVAAHLIEKLRTRSDAAARAASVSSTDPQTTQPEPTL
ncbi:MAG: hypothetical protein V3V20_00755 [Algisphaera sp.]